MQDFAFVSYRRRKTFGAYILWMLGLALFHAAVFNPIYLWITSDVLLSETVLSLILNVLSDIYNYLFYWVTFAFFVFAMTRFSLSTALGIGGVFLGGMALRYLLDTLGGYIVMGFPALDDFWFSLVFIGFDLLGDLFLVGIAFLIAWIIFSSQKERLRPKEKKVAFFEWMPASSFWSLQNPVLLMSLSSCVWMGLWMIGSRIYFDLNVGAPTGPVDLLWMITYYLSDLAMILVGYLVVHLLLNQGYMNELRSEELYSSRDGNTTES